LDCAFAYPCSAAFAYDKQDYAAALKEWEPLAKQGNADAQNNLGTMYANGKGVLKDDKQAASWYQKAAQLQC
jgi:TPR repeat protein